MRIFGPRTLLRSKSTPVCFPVLNENLRIFVPSVLTCEYDSPSAIGLRLAMVSSRKSPLVMLFRSSLAADICVVIIMIAAKRMNVFLIIGN